MPLASTAVFFTLLTMSQCDSTIAVHFHMRTPEAAALTSTAESFDFSSEMIVKKVSSKFVFTAIRYYLERLKVSSSAPTEINVVNARDTDLRVIIPLAVGDGVVKIFEPREYAIKYDIRRSKISLKSENKRMLYDFVYDAMDAYDKIISN